MAAMRVQHYNYRRRQSLLGCGCLVVLAGLLVMLVVGALIVIPLLPSIGMRLVGFVPQGSTDAIFAQVTSAPVVQLENPEFPAQAVINLGSYGSQELPANPNGYTVAVSGDREMASVAFSQEGLMDLCRQVSPVCRGEDSRFRNVRLDLRPGGAVMYADMTLLGISQTVGFVLQYDRSLGRLQVAGVDVNGALYAASLDASGGLGEQISQVDQIANDILAQLTLQAAGSSYRLTDVVIDENTLTLVLQ